MGMGALSLGGFFGGSLAMAETSPNYASPLAPKQPHFPAKAKRVIHIFANGGPSHVDTFDPKPSLDKFHGKAIPLELKTERKTGAAYRSPFKFQKYGKSGIEVSELFSHVAESIDEIAVIRSTYADVPNHEPSLLLMNCGDARLVRPAMGSWVTYGLGSENQNLPGFIAMCPGGYPIQESQNWQSGFLPGVYQGTYIDTQHTRIEKLIENIRNNYTSREEQRSQLDLLQKLNDRHAKARQQDAQLESRIQSFELAYRMQMDATDAFDISREPQHIRDMYGEGTQARQILIARRLVERGVRFVQIWHGAGQPWDNHDDIEVNHRRLAKESDQDAERGLPGQRDADSELGLGQAAQGARRHQPAAPGALQEREEPAPGRNLLADGLRARQEIVRPGDARGAGVRARARDLARVRSRSQAHGRMLADAPTTARSAWGCVPPSTALPRPPHRARSMGGRSRPGSGAC